VDAVRRRVDGETLALESSCDEGKDAGLVLHDQDPHANRRRYNR